MNIENKITTWKNLTSDITENWIREYFDCSEDEEVYVLVGVDNSVLNEQAKTTLNNELAMYQEFKASKAQEELAKEIDKKFKRIL